MRRSLLLAASLAYALPAGATVAVQAPAELQQAAEEGLQTVRQLAAATSWARFGFDSQAEAARAALGRPLHLYRAGLDRVAAYVPGSDPEATLIDTGSYVVPVTVDGRARSLIQLSSLRGAWRAVSFGQATQARALQEVLDRHGAGHDYVLIDSPAIFVMLIEDVGDKTAASVYADRRLGVAAGAFMPLRSLFELLAPLARQTDPNVPDSAPRP